MNTMLDLTQKILGLDGEPIAEDLTLKHVICEALLANPGKDRDNLSAETSTKRGRLAVKINAVDEIELGVKDLVMIREAVGRTWKTPVAGPALDIIDPAG